MSEMAHEAGGKGPSHRGVEIGVAAGLAIIALIGMWGGLKAGIGWAAEGPQAGFFPFWVSVIILISCAINFAGILAEPSEGKLFAEWGQLVQVLKVVVPTTIYVLLVPVLGIYVPSALLIATFMKWFGRYNWLLVAAISVAVPIVIFFIFEEWFLVPLPKGPVEAFLGY